MYSDVEVCVDHDDVPFIDVPLVWLGLPGLTVVFDDSGSPADRTVGVAAFVRVYVDLGKTAAEIMRQQG